MQPPPQKEQEAGLEALCAAMAWRGFHYASFVRRGLLEEGLAPLPPEATGKPLDCVYFSLVCRDDDYDDNSLLPAWYRWIQANTHALPRYGACDLAFARFRPDTLIPATDPRLGPGRGVCGAAALFRKPSGSVLRLLGQGPRRRVVRRRRAGPKRHRQAVHGRLGGAYGGRVGCARDRGGGRVSARGRRGAVSLCLRDAEASFRRRGCVGRGGKAKKEEVASGHL